MNLANLFFNEENLLHLPAGEILFRQGDLGYLMYVLISGTVEINVNHKVVETAEKGAIVGELAMISQLGSHTRSATVIAKSDCIFFQIDHERFHSLIQQMPIFAQCVLLVIADRLRRTDELL